MQYEELKEKVVQWGADKGILEKSNPIRQLQKTQEELDETMQALVQFADAKTDKDKQDALDEVIDGIGDMIVTIILLSKLVGVETVPCLESAYNVIAARTGKMENGLFVRNR
jgi:NTP pyrophosphatase (non-canonical NTP hydrolase)